MDPLYLRDSNRARSCLDSLAPDTDWQRNKDYGIPIKVYGVMFTNITEFNAFCGKSPTAHAFHRKLGRTYEEMYERWLEQHERKAQSNIVQLKKG